MMKSTPLVLALPLAASFSSMTCPPYKIKHNYNSEGPFYDAAACSPDKVQRFPGMNAGGPNMKSDFNGQEIAEQECIAACQATPGCKQVTHAYGQCYLKDWDPNWMAFDDETDTIAGISCPPGPPVDPDFNMCEGQKPLHYFESIVDPGRPAVGDEYYRNTYCMRDGVVQVFEQAGANVTRGYKGKLDVAGRAPITEPFEGAGLCPVNVHFNLGAEHLSVGQYDQLGKGPKDAGNDVRLGFRCHHYNPSDARFTADYEWKYCTDVKVGETYEVKWPHSAAGACGTKWQYQTPFYDGLFCKDGIISRNPLNMHEKIGVQAQTFTIINDESYYRGNLMEGMLVDDSGHGQDIAMYTGSTSGTSRSNDICSRYAPISYQVDRKCHLISASSFDNMCKQMLEQHDDMSNDVHPHGSRTLVMDQLAANNQQSR